MSLPFFGKTKYDPWYTTKCDVHQRVLGVGILYADDIINGYTSYPMYTQHYTTLPVNAQTLSSLL